MHADVRIDKSCWDPSAGVSETSEEGEGPAAAFLVTGI